MANGHGVIENRGKMSMFGGPDDTGVGPDEGLALIEPQHFSQLQEYLLPTPPPGTTSLARRLNPDSFYLACRWHYSVTPASYLRQSMATVENPANGLTAEARPVDWGPDPALNRVADLSPGLAAFLGLETEDEVIVSIDCPA